MPLYVENEFRQMLKAYEDKLKQQQRNEPLNTDELCIAFNNAFLDANEELFNCNIDVRFSGSTCVSLMTLG